MQQLAPASGAKARALAVKARLTRLRLLHASPLAAVSGHNQNQRRVVVPHGGARRGKIASKITSAALAAHSTVVYEHKQGRAGSKVGARKV